MEKEKMKLWKKAVIVLLLLLAIFIILTARKYMIMKELVNASKEYENKTNYIAVTSLIQKDMVCMEKSYNKDGNFLTERKFYGKSFDDVVTFTSYKNGEDEMDIIQRGENKEIKDKLTEERRGSITSAYNCFAGKIDLKTAISSRVTTNNYNGKECYLIEERGRTLWVDKDTGLVYRLINGAFGLREFVYEFDVVEDIKKPNL